MHSGVTLKQELPVKRISVWQIAAVPFVTGLAVRMLLVAFVQIMHGNFFSSTIRVMIGLDGLLPRHGT